jgi:hypothetical protein
MYLACRRSIGFRGRGIDPLKYPCLHRTTQTKENFHTSVPCVAFEPTFPVFERWKASHAIDPVATVIGTLMRYASHLSASPSQDLFFFFSPHVSLAGTSDVWCRCALLAKIKTLTTQVLPWACLLLNRSVFKDQYFWSSECVLFVFGMPETREQTPIIGFIWYSLSVRLRLCLQTSKWSQACISLFLNHPTFWQ